MKQTIKRIHWYKATNLKVKLVHAGLPGAIVKTVVCPNCKWIFRRKMYCKTHCGYCEAYKRQHGSLFPTSGSFNPNREILDDLLTSEDVDILISKLKEREQAIEEGDEDDDW